MINTSIVEDYVLKLQEIFLIESPVSELETTLQKPHSYDAIDHMMTGICKKYKVTPKQLHDLFVKKHGKTPDEWISEITEAPIVDIEPLGDFDKPGGFRSPVDKRIVTNPAIHSRARKFFSRSPYDFRIYPINVPGGSKFLETGQVSMDWLEKNLPVAAQKLQEVPQKQDEIVVFFTSNIGAEKVPLTPWMMAHRIGHAFRASRKNDSGINTAFDYVEKEIFEFFKMVLQNLYNKQISIEVGIGFFPLIQKPITRALFANIGTMRSARSVNQYNRPYEFIYEMFAQYINTGEIKFNTLPESFRYSDPRGGPLRNFARANPEEISDYNYELQSFGSTLEYYFDSILSSAQGKIFVM